MSEEKEPTFKVSDRRLFNSDGTPRSFEHEPEREEAPVVMREASPAAVAARPVETMAPEGDDGAAEDFTDADEPSRFSEFVMELATNAMMTLGMMEHPQYGRIPPDLASARHFIDLLGMLEEKTRNNLTAAESRHLAETIDALRMQYVGLSSQRR
jgi:hypothetical protein